MTFDKLYKTDSNKNTRTWEIKVVKYDNYSEIIVSHGVLDGKKIISTKIVSTGKNIGKINETDHYTQALSEAKSKWEKKISQESYSVDVKPSNAKNDTIFPMLAHSFKLRGHQIVFPCHTQPKIDGIRAIYNKGSLTSRKGKKFTNFEYITNELKEIPYILDGELYNHGVPLQDISGMVRKQKSQKVIKNLIYIVYDVIIPGNYTERYSILEDIFKNNKFKNIQLIKNFKCKDHEDIQKFHDLSVSQGYEGAILRNFEGHYTEGQRSKNLQKFKDFEDSEFEIVGFTDGEGSEKGLVIWKCVTDTGLIFDVRPRGTHSERRKLFLNAEKYIGKFLTIRYHGFNKSGIPNIAVGIAIRDYE